MAVSPPDWIMLTLSQQVEQAVEAAANVLKEVKFRTLCFHITVRNEI